MPVTIKPKYLALGSDDDVFTAPGGRSNEEKLINKLRTSCFNRLALINPHMHTLETHMQFGEQSIRTSFVGASVTVN